MRAPTDESSHTIDKLPLTDDPTAAPSGGTSLSQGFKSELAEWLEPLRQALSQLLREVGSPSTPRLLEHQLTVPYATCWRVFRIVRATDVTAEARHAPLPGALKGLLRSALNHGLTEKTAAAVSSTADQFRRFITRHAQDRSTFDSMVAPSSDSSRARTVVLQRRRTVYRALSQLWGVQTDLHAVTCLVGPPADDPDSSYFETVRLSLQRGVRRLRSDVPVTLVGYHIRPNQTPAEALVPLDPDAARQYGMPILPEFSSAPMPSIEPIDMTSGWRLYNLVGGDVGLRSNIEFASGTKSNKTYDEITADGRPLYTIAFTASRKPVALLVLDLLLHRASWPGVVPQSLVYHHQEGDFTQATAERSQRFPGDEKVDFAGRADMLQLIEAPRYGELLRYAAAAKKWDLADFDAYRITIPYPLVGTTTRLFYHGTR